MPCLPYQAFYGTRANPFDKEFEWGRITRKGDDRLYLIMYGKPESGKIELPCTFDKGKVKASMLHGNKAVKVEQDAERNMCVIDVSSVQFNEPATVLELQGKWSL